MSILIKHKHFEKMRWRIYRQNFHLRLVYCILIFIGKSPVLTNMLNFCVTYIGVNYVLCLVYNIFSKITKIKYNILGVKYVLCLVYRI